MPKKRRNPETPGWVDPDKPNLVLREVEYIVAQAAESDASVVTLG